MKVSDDGLARSHSDKGDVFIDHYNQICLDMDAKEKSWIEFLRHVGVKMAHPDDGWVDRKENSISPAYPQFDDGVSVGDIICLGWPSDKRSRLVRVIKIKSGGFVMHRKIYYFEEITSKVINKVGDKS